MAKEKEQTKLTKDTLFDGDLLCYQNKEGYRFSIDSVLLAHFCLKWKNANILDLGCGCGILGLILLYRNATNISSITGIEYQDSLVKMARKNIRENNYDEKYLIQQCDLKYIHENFKAENFSHIICNPPFYSKGSGRINQNDEALIARHQVMASTYDIAKSMAYATKNRGIVSLIFPADLLANFMMKLNSNKLEPKVLRLVYSYPESQTAKLALLECAKNGGTGLQVEKPLYIYQRKNGNYTSEVAAMYNRNV